MTPIDFPPPKKFFLIKLRKEERWVNQPIWRCGLNCKLDKEMQKVKSGKLNGVDRA